MKRFALLYFGIALVLFSVDAATPVETGFEVLAAENFKPLQGKRVGLLTNHTAIGSDGRSIVERFRNAAGVKLVALLSPEHGLYGAEAAGVNISNSTDPLTGLPVYSLHGDTRKPTQAMLQGLDVLVYDLQDIGCRSYTYISTLGLAMEAAGEAGIEFFVLDRPNPLGGERVEGMPLDPAFRSFVGKWDIPYVYGLTPAELARMIQGERWITSRPKLTLVPMRGWNRSMTWKETGLTWIPTSPHIPTAETSAHYVMTGLIGELGVVSTGVGYTIPFGMIGHPTLNAFEFSAKLNSLGNSGVYFRPAFYKPFYGSLKGQLCQGSQIHLLQPNAVNLSACAMQLMEELRGKLGASWLTNIPEDKKSLFDKVCGGNAVRLHFIEGKQARLLIESWEPALQHFREMRTKYLLYPADPKK